MSSKKNESSIHRKLGSVNTNIKSLQTGQELTVNGRTLLTEAALLKVLNMTNKGETIPEGCVSIKNITMISEFVYFDIERKNMIVKSDFIGMYDPLEIKKKIDNEVLKPYVIYKLQKPESEVTEQEINEKIDSSYNNIYNFTSFSALFTAPYYTYIAKSILEQNNISEIRSHFLNCPMDKYFFIPLTLLPFGPVDLKLPNHANGIFISKAKGTVFRIEPQYYVNDNDPDYKEKQARLNQAVIRLTNEIGLKDPTFINIKVPCPQAIVEDKNCIFWSLLIFEQIIKNLYKKDINTVIQEISLKPKQELEKIIYEYKKDLFNIWVPKGLNKFQFSWPEFEVNKQKILEEIETEHRGYPLYSLPTISKYPIRIGGKYLKNTRRIIMKAGDIFRDKQLEREKELQEIAKKETAKKTIRQLSNLKQGGKRHRNKTKRRRSNRK